MVDASVRIAGPDDEEPIFQMCVALHTENGQHPLNLDKARQVIRKGTEARGAIIGVIGPTSDIRGVVYLLLDPIYYSDDYQLLELFLYVRPDRRMAGLRYARALIEFAKSCADRMQMDLTIGVISNIRLKAKARLYGQLLPKGGEFFIYSPKRAA